MSFDSWRKAKHGKKSSDNQPLMLEANEGGGYRYNRRGISDTPIYEEESVTPARSLPSRASVDEPSFFKSFLDKGVRIGAGIRQGVNYSQQQRRLGKEHSYSQELQEFLKGYKNPKQAPTGERLLTDYGWTKAGPELPLVGTPRNIAGTLLEASTDPINLAIGEATGGVTRLLPFAKTGLGSLAKNISAGAVEGGVSTAADAYAKDKAVLPAFATGAVGGGVLGGALDLGGKALSRVPLKNRYRLPELKKAPVELPEIKPNSVQPALKNEASISSKPILSKLPPNTETVTGPKERQFSQNVMDSQIATDDIKQNLKQNKLTYEPITNKETFSKATDIVNKNADEALELFNSPSKGVSADDVALGEALITKAIKDGNPAEANRLIADLAEKLTTAGQAVQAASIFKKLTPEGMLLYAQRTINSANKDLIKRKGAKAKKIILTPEDSEFILNTMKDVQLLPDGRDKEIAMAKVMQLIADKVPATLSEKVQGLQRISLLLNPKTMVRNTVGNTLFGAIDNLSNVVATPIDKLTSRFTGKRTTTLPSLKGQLRSGLQGAKETIEDARLGIDTYAGQTQFELPSKRIFETNVLNKLDKTMRTGLELGDRPFYKAAYDDVLRQQMKLANVNEPTQAMIEQAHKIAQQRTYQDANALTSAFKKIQNALNLGKKVGLGNIVLPFVKTPANILKRAIEYSPVGIEKALREATKLNKGMFDQKTFVDSIARSVTGTALIMVGYDLAKKGIITGSGNEDKDIAAFERNLGKNDFAFKYGDNYYTYDWAQPASMGLAIGADVFLKGKDRKEAESIVSDAIKSGGETLFKQSLLQGVQRFMGGFNPIDNIESTVINAPTQFVPTLSKQITQLTDPIQRSTYSQSKLGTGANLVKAKLPWASRTLEPRIDTFGNEVKNYQGKNNLFNIFLNPGNSTEFKPNKVQKEILRAYESTGDKGIFPKVAPKYFTVKGRRFDLTPEEITGFQRTMGRRTEERMAKIVDIKQPDETKAKMLKKIIEQSYDEAKLELLRNRGIK